MFSSGSSNYNIGMDIIDFNSSILSHSNYVPRAQKFLLKCYLRPSYEGGEWWDMTVISSINYDVAINSSGRNNYCILSPLDNDTLA